MNNLGTLYQYEIKKLLKRKIVWITLLVCLIVTAFSIAAGLIGSYYIDGVKADTHYHMFRTDREYQKVLDGREINQSLLEEMSKAYGMIPTTAERYIITEEYQKYARPYSEIFNFVRNTTHMNVSEVMQWLPDEKDLYAKRRIMLEKTWKDAVLQEGEKNFWLQKEAEIKTPFTYRITEGYFALFRAITTIGLCMLLAVAICLSNVFAEEHNRRTDQLILCSTHGKSKVYWAKILAGISFAISISIVVSAFAFVLALGLYGAEGFNAMFQIMYAESSYPITVGQAILIIYGLLVVTTVLVSVFVMVLSEMLHSNIATLAITSGILIFSMICSVPSQYRILSQIWDWFPSAFLTPWNIFDVRLISIMGSYFTAWQAVPLIYLLMGIAIVMIGKFIYRCYQISGR